jgi:hypothetical protein
MSCVSEVLDIFHDRGCIDIYVTVTKEKHNDSSEKEHGRSFRYLTLADVI